MIDLEFLTKDPETIDLIKRYWQLNSDGTPKISWNELFPNSTKLRFSMFEFTLSTCVIAWDTRQRCPVCSMPKRLENREQALQPITQRPPCDDCRYLKRRRATATGPVTVVSQDETGSSGQATFPIAAMVIFDALERVLGQRVYSEFRAGDCEGLAPAHINRFIAKLCAANVIRKMQHSENIENTSATTIYCLADENTFKREFALFKNLLTERKLHERHGLWEVWLDYAVAGCVRLIAEQCTLHGLPTDPDDEELCSVLRSAIAKRSIAAVKSISLLAVQDAHTMVEQGSSCKTAAMSVPKNIARRSIKTSSSTSRTAADPAADLGGALGAWFQDWLGINEHTPGPIILDSILPRIVQDSPAP